MIAIILSWAFIFLIALSFGEILVQLWNKFTKRDDFYSVFDKFWMGVSLVGTILLSISIFFAISVKVLAILAIASCIYWLGNKTRISDYIARFKAYLKNITLGEKAIFAFTALVIIIYSLCTPLIFDEGLYHLQTMEWLDKHQTIAGLANLHSRFGFNSSFLLLSAVFNYHPSSYFVFFSLNSLSLFIFSCWIIKQCIAANNIIRKGALILILLVSIFSLGTNASSTSTDILANIFVMYILLKWTLQSHFLERNTLMLSTLAIFCVTLKLSAAIIVLACLVCLIHLAKNKEYKASTFIIGFGLLVAIPWLTRFFLTTGYLIYPLPNLDIFDVDWKLPIEMVTEERDLAYAWARIPELDTSTVLSMSFGEWFPMWVENQSLYVISLYLVAVLSPITIFIINAIAKNRHVLYPWGIALVGFLFGFYMAPDFRFSLGYILCAGLIPFISYNKESSNSRCKRRLVHVCYTFALTGIVYLGYVAYSQVNLYQHDSTQTKYSLILRPQPIDILKRRTENGFTEYKLKNTTIFVPQETNQCFDHNIPCMPYYNNNIEMRGESIESGFRIKK